MKRTRIFILTTVFLALGNPLLASPPEGRVGNGGSGIQVGNAIHLLDLVEIGSALDPYFDASVSIDPAIRKRVFNAIGRIEGSPVDLVTRKLCEIGKSDRLLELVLLKAMELYDWALVDGSLGQVGDVETVLDVDPSKLVQLAVRAYRTIRLSGDYWSQLPPEHRAALIFHEVVYATLPLEDVSAGYPARFKQSSPRARDITGYLFHGPVSNPKLRDIVKSFLPLARESQSQKIEEIGSELRFDPSAQTAIGPAIGVTISWYGITPLISSWPLDPTQEENIRVYCDRAHNFSERRLLLGQYSKVNVHFDSYLSQNGEKMEYVRLEGARPEDRPNGATEILWSTAEESPTKSACVTELTGALRTFFSRFESK